MKDWIKILDLKATEDQRLWLNKTYEIVSNIGSVNYRILKSELNKKIPVDFDPNTIDNRLAFYKGTELTILGIEYLDPERKILEKADIVIKAIRKLMVENPRMYEITIEDLNRETKLDIKELDLTLMTISQFRNPVFFNGYTSTSDVRYSTIHVSGDDIFDNYLRYYYLDDVIEAWIKELEKEETRTKELNIITGKRKSGKRSLYDQLHDTEQEIQIDQEGAYFKPIFRSPIPKVNEALCFVLMPFGESWSNEVWTHMIRPFVEELGLQCLRADSTHGLSIIEDIWTYINQSAFVIADLSQVNPNVMYEIGIVHTIGKPSILITQEIKTQPFDVNYLRKYEYEVSVGGAEIFKKTLHDVIRDIYKKNYPDYHFEK